MRLKTPAFIQDPAFNRSFTVCLFSEVSTWLSSSGVPSHDFHRNFCVACAVTVGIFAHLNHSFFIFLLFTVMAVMATPVAELVATVIFVNEN